MMGVRGLIVAFRSLATRRACVNMHGSIHNATSSTGTIMQRKFCSAKPRPYKETVTINLSVSTGEKKSVEAKVGDNLLDVVIDNDLDISGFGACEGTLACSTCHLIFKQSDYDCLPEKPTDEELDMLDLAYGLSDTSRLGCQVIVTKDMKDWDIVVPAGVSDAREP